VVVFEKKSLNKKNIYIVASDDVDVVESLAAVPIDVAKAVRQVQASQKQRRMTK
jgi:hypothetical protein